MATQPPYQSLYRLVLNQRWSGSVTVASTLHVASRGFTPTSAQVGSHFLAEVFPTWRARTASAMTFESLSVEQFVPDVLDRAILQINQTGAVGQPLTESVALQPAPLALVVTWRTPFPGRRGRGRWYYLGNWVRTNDGVRWHTDNVGNVNAIADQIRNKYTALANAYALELVVFSRSIGGRQPPYDVAGAHQVTAHTAQAYYATMGSRRLGHGI